MIDPYRMVVVNLLAVLFVALFLLFYKFIFPKKNPPYILALLLFSILPLISILRKGSYESGDLSLHAMRTISYYKILFYEHILPRWTPEFNAGYGDPHFLFTYLLPYFISSILHKVGFSFIWSIKFLLSLFYVFSGLAMYYWVKELFGKKSGFIAGIFYLFSPYHLIDMHFRVSIAESMSFAFLPALLYFSTKIIYQNNKISVIFLSILLSLLILTHQIISLSFLVLLIGYCFLIYKLKTQKSVKDLYPLVKSIFLGLMISSFYWFPILIEGKLTQASLIKSIVIFPNLSDLIYAPWRFGLLFQGHKGEVAYIIGYAQLIVLVFSILIVFKKFKSKKYVFNRFFLGITFLLIFLILPISKFIWDNLPFLNYFQFSYRLLVFVSLSTSVLAGIVILNYKQKSLFMFLVCFSILSTILNWGNRKSLPAINDDYLYKEFSQKPDVGSYLEPSSPIWANEKSVFLRKNDGKHMEIVYGKSEIKELNRKSAEHNYLITTHEKTEVKENTLFFPGWKVYVNNKETIINYMNQKYPGVITFVLDKGKNMVTVKFEDTWDRKYSKYVSLLGVLGLVYVFFSNNTYIPSAKRSRKRTHLTILK